MFLGTHISVGILWLMRSGTDLSIFKIKMQNAYPNNNVIHFLQFRYVQAPLAYPRERKRRMNSEGWLPFCVYRDGFNPEIYPALWSDYYNKTKGSPRTLSSHRGSPGISRSTISSTDPYWSSCLPNWMQFVRSGRCWSLHLPGGKGRY
jgi:hypothetical protein